MSILIRIFKWITFATVGLVVLAVVLVLFDMYWAPNYDDDDPRYQKLVSRLAEIRQSRKPDGSIDIEEGIDLSDLNGGDWTTACVFGGYNDPLEEMEKLGAKVSDEDRAQLGELKGGFRIAQVEEFEIMFTFIDLTGTAQFVHFEGGIGSAGQHLEQCITKPQTVIDLRDA